MKILFATDNAMQGIVAQVAANIRRVAENKEPLHQFDPQ